MDLRPISSLIADACTNINHPVSALSDAAQNLAGKSLFSKLDCSKGYHCLQMADQRSVEMRAFNFASRTLPTKDLRRVSIELCPPFQVSCAKTWTNLSRLTAQNMDDIGIAAKKATDLARNIRTVFKWVCQAGLKLTIDNCHFGFRQLEFLETTI